MGVLVRSGPLSDAGVRRLIAEYFVPVAIDVGSVRGNWRFAPQGTPNADVPLAAQSEAELFAQLEQQEEMSQGIWLVTPDWTVLGASYHTTAGPMLGMMQVAVRKWQGRGGGRPEPLPAAPADCLQPPLADPGHILVQFSGRILAPDEVPPFRDFAEFDPAQWALHESAAVGTSFELPQQLLQEVGSRLYPGEMRLAVHPEELELLQATVTIHELDASVARGELTGRLRISGDRHAGQRRVHEATLRGRLQWSLPSRRLMSLQLVSDGQWQAEYPPGISPGAADIYPTFAGRSDLVMSPPIRLLFLIEFVPRS